MDSTTSCFGRRAAANPEPRGSRNLDSQLSFADLELSRLGVHLDPVLQGIDAFLGQHSDLVEQVRRDLERGLKNPTTGRSGITPSQTLRSSTLMRVKNRDYRELRERINDGYTLRGFTQFDSHLVPKHDAFHRAFNRLTPATRPPVCPARLFPRDFCSCPPLLGREFFDRCCHPGPQWLALPYFTVTDFISSTA